MKWVTYFPKLSNVHLTKDLGLIPLYMQQVCGYRSLLVGQFPDFDRAGIDDEASKLQLEILDDGGSISFIDRAFISFIRKHARSIQVLNLFQLNRDNLVYGLAYTYFNHTGILYLKLDADNRNFLNRKVHSSSWAKRRILGALEKRFFKVVHVVSVENKRGFNLIDQSVSGRRSGTDA